MTKKLFVQAITKFLLGAALVGLLIFLPAGTVRYPNGWLLMGLLFVPMFCAALLQKRLDAKERQAEQSLIVKLSGVMFVGGFVLAGLDFRLGWTVVPVWAVRTAAVVFLLAYGLYAEVLRENAYLSRTIEVQEGQKVIDTGLYGVVRHPMYSATILLFLSMPLLLGSWVSFVVFLAYPLLIVKRLRSEEALLTADLPGYGDYCKKVRFRLIPFVW